MFIKLPGKLQQELKTLTVVVSGGGTGGHVYPAIAIADELTDDVDIEKVIYIGCPDSLEEKVAAEHEFDFLPIRITGMPRKASFKFLKWLYMLNRAVLDVLGYLLYVKPDVVFATGGYVSGPVLIASLILDVPYVIHEADAYPGIVNRKMSAWATGISVAFEQAKDYMKSKAVNVLGNPLRSTIGEFKRSEAAIFLDIDPEKQTLLVLGGSQGAKKINDAVIEILPDLLETKQLQIIHQCGPKNYDEIYKNLSRDVLENPAYVLRGFFDDLAVPLACADFAVSRAGSMTLSELTACMIPSILVPYPYAAADHQRKNARYMLDSGAALFLENDECTGENLLNYIDAMVDTVDKLDYMRLACGRISRKHASEDIVELIKKAAKLETQSSTRHIEDN